MPPSNELPKHTSAKRIAKELGDYPSEAYDFVQRGLSYTVEKFHAEQTDKKASRHVSGQQLSEGLRDYALLQWGLLARTVLKAWGIHSTFDFGKIVFSLIEAQQMQKTEDDTVDDFRDVYDFDTAFEAGYRIQLTS
jgi:uncharacterized repeat protein (TIGR04138 family)